MDAAKKQSKLVRPRSKDEGLSPSHLLIGLLGLLFVEVTASSITGLHGPG